MANLGSAIRNIIGQAGGPHALADMARGGSMYSRTISPLGLGAAPALVQILQPSQVPIEQPPSVPVMDFGLFGDQQQQSSGFGLLSLLPMVMSMGGGGLTGPGGLLSNFTSDPWLNVRSAYNLSNMMG